MSKITHLEGEAGKLPLGECYTVGLPTGFYVKSFYPILEGMSQYENPRMKLAIFNSLNLLAVNSNRNSELDGKVEIQLPTPEQYSELVDRFLETAKIGSSFIFSGSLERFDRRYSSLTRIMDTLSAKLDKAYSDQDVGFQTQYRSLVRFVQMILNLETSGINPYLSRMNHIANLLIDFGEFLYQSHNGATIAEAETTIPPLQKSK